MASRSDVELEDEAALMLQPEGLGALAVAAFEEEEAAEAHRSTSDEWWNLPPHHLNKRQSSNVSILFRNDGQP
ncbi:BnaCnng46810D [Brassica napus]|uniref:BnaCnng46810D protein n=1 Tax=Brassica napus TaxID=3708 RepID=A0A078JFY8_BRANA|nr:BnaCnng46810D [Brassica napus]